MIAARPALATLVAAALGALCVLGFAPFDQWFAVWPAPTLALGGLLLLWQRAPDPRRAGLLGLAWGAGFFLCGVSWVYVSLSEFGGMAPPAAAAATLAFCLYLALFPALVGYLYRRYRSAHVAAVDGQSLTDALLFAGLWAIAEWLRGTLFTGFPWLAIGYSQSPPSPLAGWAAVLGVYGISFILALIAGLLAHAWRRPAAWISIALLLAGGALLRAMDWTQPQGAPLQVSLLQGNVPQSLKWDPRRLPLSIDTYLALAKAHPATLTVLPETAIPLYFNEVPRDVLRGLTTHGSALIGVAVSTRDGGYTNGAVAVTPELTVSAYAKRHLVPFGEYPPPGFAWFFRFARIPMSDFTAGPPLQAPLEIAGQRIAPNICYEDLFGEELLDALPAATLLINLSNTAWFGDSLAQPQHLQIARLRALETGRTMLRATNTGMTAMVHPDGSIAAALPPFSSGALVVEAQGRSGMTPFARWGNALALLLAACACIPALRRRKTQSL
jgi:apolipoprotein N-acyltransferase